MNRAILEVFGTVQKGLDLFWGGGIGMRVEVVLGWGSGTTISKKCVIVLEVTSSKSLQVQNRWGKVAYWLIVTRLEA